MNFRVYKVRRLYRLAKNIYNPDDDKVILSYYRFIKSIVIDKMLK